jgi:hypothetical protein
MPRLKKIGFALGLCAQLTSVWLTLAPGLVLCMEEDGRIAVETSIDGGVCGDVSFSAMQVDHPWLSTMAFSHCNGCQDVPLFLTGGVAAEHQHVDVVSPATVAATPSLAALIVTRPTSTTVPPTRALRVMAPSNTVLRI